MSWDSLAEVIQFALAVIGFLSLVAIIDITLHFNKKISMSLIIVAAIIVIGVGCYFIFRKS